LRALRWGCPSIGTTARLADDLSKRFPEDTPVGIDRTMIQAGILIVSVRESPGRAKAR
jgi:hypothetical protein